MFRFVLTVQNHYSPNHILLYFLLLLYLFHNYCYLLMQHPILLPFQDIRLHFPVLLLLPVQGDCCYCLHFQVVRNRYIPTHILFRLLLMPMYAMLPLLLLLYLLNIDFLMLRLLLAVPLFHLHHFLIPAVHNCYNPMPRRFRLF